MFGKIIDYAFGVICRIIDGCEVGDGGTRMCFSQVGNGDIEKAGEGVAHRNKLENYQKGHLF